MMVEYDIEVTVDRFARRYAERRFILGNAIEADIVGMKRDFLRLDIASRRLVHVLRPDWFRLVRWLVR